MDNNDKILFDFMLRPENEPFFSHILNKYKSNNFTKLSNKDFCYHYDVNDKIESMIAVSSGYSFLAKVKPCHYDWMKEILLSNLYNIFFIYFDENIFQHFQKDTKVKFREVVHYNVMQVTQQSFNPQYLPLEKQNHFFSDKKTNTFSCYKLGLKDFEKFKILQKKYHLEEVYRNTIHYPENSEMQNFKKELDNGINYGILLNEKAVAKSSINSITKNTFQIGGVFTDKMFRHNKLSTHCLSTMINDCLEIKPIMTLFVRTDNQIAINLYKKLGFTITGNTVLAYIN